MTRKTILQLIIVKIWIEAVLLGAYIAKVAIVLSEMTWPL